MPDSLRFVPIVGISAARPQSGKTTLAAALAVQEDFVKISFADPLKSLSDRILLDLGYSPDQARLLNRVYKEALIPEIGCTSRHIQRSLGTEWGRDLIDQELWVKIWKARAWAAIKEGARGIVVDDVRFQNEIQALKRIGAVSVFVNRPEPVKPALQRFWAFLNKPLFEKQHRSEGAIKISDPQIDLVIHNTKDESIYKKICEEAPSYIFRALQPEATFLFKHFCSYMAKQEATRKVVHDPAGKDPFKFNLVGSGQLKTQATEQSEGGS